MKGWKGSMRMSEGRLKCGWKAEVEWPKRPNHRQSQNALRLRNLTSKRGRLLCLFIKNKTVHIISDLGHHDSTNPLFSCQFMKFLARCFESWRRVTNLNEDSTLHHNDSLFYFQLFLFLLLNEPKQKQPIIEWSKRLYKVANQTLDCPDITLSILWVIVSTSWRDILFVTVLRLESFFPLKRSFLKTHPLVQRFQQGECQDMCTLGDRLKDRQSTCSFFLMSRVFFVNKLDLILNASISLSGRNGFVILLWWRACWLRPNNFHKPRVDDWSFRNWLLWVR